MGREDVLDDGNDSLNYTDYERRLVRTCVSQVNFGKPKKPSLLGLQLPQGCELIRRAVWTGS
jgi:hypothetical protein